MAKLVAPAVQDVGDLQMKVTVMKVPVMSLIMDGEYCMTVIGMKDSSEYWLDIMRAIHGVNIKHGKVQKKEGSAS